MYARRSGFADRFGGPHGIGGVRGLDATKQFPLRQSLCGRALAEKSKREREQYELGD